MQIIAGLPVFLGLNIMSDNVTQDYIRVLKHCALAHMKPLACWNLQITLPTSLLLWLFLQPALPSCACTSDVLMVHREAFIVFPLQFKYAGVRLLSSPAKLFKIPNFVNKQVGYFYGYTTILCLFSHLKAGVHNNTSPVHFEKV